MLENKLHVFLKTSVLIGVLLLALAGCSRFKELPMFVPPLNLAKMNHLWVTTSDYQSGMLVGIDLLQNDLSPFKIPIHSDAIVRAPLHSPYFYVVNRLGADNIQWGIRNQTEVLGQFSVGRGTNPQDIAVLNSAVAYVTRLESKHLLKVNPVEGKSIKEIDLFEKADSKVVNSTDPDGFPEMTWMLLKENKLMILLQRLNSEQGFEPSNKSQLAILNTDTDTVEDILNLKGTNPVTEIKEFSNRYIIGEAGKLGVLDGGIEMFDSHFKSLGWVTDEKKLGGDIVDCSLIDDERGVAIVAKDNYTSKASTQLVVFRILDGRIISILREPGKFTLQQVLVDSERHILFVSDRDPKKPGVWAYHIKTLEPVSTSYYQTGLPPYHMVLAK